MVDSWSGIDNLVISTINLGDGDHDPESFDWDPSPYRYAASADGIAVPSIVAAPGPVMPNPAVVQRFHTNGQPNPYGLIEAYPDQGYGVSVACGDPDGDGVDEILTGPGPGPDVPPVVKLFEANGQEFTRCSFVAYGVGSCGVNVAFADLDNDGRDEILTGAGSGTMFSTHVRGWNYDGSYIEPVPGCSFIAFPPDHRYGANVAVGRFRE